MAPKKTTRVSPSARSEGSRAKPVAKRVSPSARREGVWSDKPTKVVESGVGNLPMTVAKGLVAVGKKIKGQQAPKAKPTIAKGAIKKTQPTPSQIKRAKDYGLTTKKEIEAFAAGDRGRFVAAAERTAARKSSNAREAQFKREEAKARAYANDKKKPKPQPKPNTITSHSPRKQKSVPYTDQFGNRGWR